MTVFFILLSIILFPIRTHGHYSKNNYVDVIVEYKNESGKEKIVEYSNEIIHDFKFMKALAVRVPYEAFLILNNDEDIGIIEKNIMIKSLDLKKQQPLNDRIIESINDTEIEKEDFVFKNFQHDYMKEAVNIAFVTSGLFEQNSLKPEDEVTAADLIQSWKDDNGYGTVVSSIISALANNLKTAGVVPDIKLYSVKALNADGTGTLVNLLRAIEWAIENNMDVISLPLSLSNYSDFLIKIFDIAYQHGITIAIVNSVECKGVISTSYVNSITNQDFSFLKNVLNSNEAIDDIMLSFAYTTILAALKQIYPALSANLMNEDLKNYFEFLHSESKETAKLSADSVASKLNMNLNKTNKSQTDYFKVTEENVAVFKNNQLDSEKIGILARGQEFPHLGVIGEFYKIKFDNGVGFVPIESTEPSKGDSIRNKVKNDVNSKRSFIPLQDAVVYDNSSGNFIPMGMITSGTKYHVISESINWWKVNFADRIGYVHKSVTQAEFIEDDEYFQVIADEAVVYDIRGGGSYKIVGKLVKGQEYKRVGESKYYHKIVYGSFYGYVPKKFTKVSNGKSINNFVGQKDKNSSLRFEAKKDVVVYDNSSGKFIPFGEISKGTEFSVISGSINWWKINYSNRIGYVHKSGTQGIFEPSDRYFQVITDNARVFDIRGGGPYKEVGLLIKGQTYERVGESGSYHKIKFGSYYGYVHKSQTSPVTELNFKNAARKNANLGKITTTERVAVYDNTGKNGFEVFLFINKGEEIPIVGFSKNWIEINISGRYGYISRSLVDLKLPPQNIVNPKQVYTYEQMKKDILQLERTYPDLIKTEIIGKSVDGRNIYAVKLGKGKEEIFINGAHHAREHMTTNLIMEMIDVYADYYTRNLTLDGYNVRKVLDQTSIWFVPMVNPDGVTLVQKGHKSAKNPNHVLKLNGYSTDFSGWKANIRGVDLNRQYPADWENVRNVASKPGPENYKGKQPLSEPEVIAIAKFTLEHNFKAAVAYHSSGEILYWYFNQGTAAMARDKAIANKIASKTGYSLVPASKNPSGGGFTDWFIQEFKKPGFTPEISPHVGPKPVPLKNFDRIWKQNRSIGLLIAVES